MAERALRAFPCAAGAAVIPGLDPLRRSTLQRRLRVPADHVRFLGPVRTLAEPEGQDHCRHDSSKDRRHNASEPDMALVIVEVLSQARAAAESQKRPALAEELDCQITLTVEQAQLSGTHPADIERVAEAAGRDTTPFGVTGVS